MPPAVAATVAIVASAGATVYQTQQAKKSAKNAAADADAKQKAALKQLQDEQASASSQAQAAIQARRARIASSNTIFTSPLGLAGTAQVARKTLTGQ